MPAGKAAVFGGCAWVGPWPHAVNIRSMRRRAKPGTRTLTVIELKECRRTLRSALQIYRIDCAAPAPTATERRKALIKIKREAQRFADIPQGSSADRLLTYLDADDLTMRSILIRHLRANGYEWIRLKRNLRDVFVASAPPDECLPAVRDLANIDVNALAPAGGRWPDPGLTKLVWTLAPLWGRVTGRTAGLVSVDKDCETKKCPFADWLGEMHDIMRIPRPPEGRVVDSVRAQKKWAQKNPAPVKA